MSFILITTLSSCYSSLVGSSFHECVCPICPLCSTETMSVSLSSTSAFCSLQSTCVISLTLPSTPSALIWGFIVMMQVMRTSLSSSARPTSSLPSLTPSLEFSFPFQWWRFPPSPETIHLWSFCFYFCVYFHWLSSTPFAWLIFLCQFPQNDV